MIKEKRYRPNVAAIVLSSKYPFLCEILVANRNDIADDAWLFPQGGIDPHESPKDALYRELLEEIGTDEVEIVAEHPDWISYDFFNKSAAKIYPFDGQKQKYFLVKLKPYAKINLNTKIPEFMEYKFIDYRNSFNIISRVKRPIYKQVLTYFKKSGYL
jgi:putative (di)nucleoside polyphosphate hydrolase